MYSTSSGWCAMTWDHVPKRQNTLYHRNTRIFHHLQTYLSFHHTLLSADRVYLTCSTLNLDPTSKIRHLPLETAKTCRQGIWYLTGKPQLQVIKGPCCWFSNRRTTRLAPARGPTSLTRYMLFPQDETGILQSNREHARDRKGVR